MTRDELKALIAHQLRCNVVKSSPFDADEDAADILAAIEAAGCMVVQGWQGIESAPRDGTPILIYTPGHDRKPVCEARWARDYEEGPGYWATPVAPSGRGYTILPSAVTHWKPLPAAPMREEG